MPNFEIISGTKYVVYNATDPDQAYEKFVAWFEGDGDQEDVEEQEVTSVVTEIEE